MNDNKVHQVSEDMECQRLTEDSKIQLYLYPMRYEKPVRHKEAIAGKLMAAAVALPYSMFITYEAGCWMIKSAAGVRGYDAIGGEYILIIVVFITSFWLIWKLLSGFGVWE